MGSQKDTIDRSTFIGSRIDSTGVYDSIMKIIKSLRSADPLQSGRVVDRADENLSSKDGESELNTFFRIIGLPAVRRETTMGSDITDKQKSQDGSLNYSTLDALGLTAADLDLLEQRETSLASAQPLGVPPAPTAQNILRGTQAMLDPLRPAYSVDNKGVQNRRSSIFPMVVCGDVPVFPIENRTSPLFYSGGNFQNNIKQHRPLIEFIIRSRATPLESGAETAELISSMKSLVDKVAESKNAAPSSQASSVNPNVEAIKATFDNQNLITLRIIQKLYQSIVQCAEDYREAVDSIGSYLKKVCYVPVLNGRAPSVLQGHFDISYADQIKALQSDPLGRQLAERVPLPELDNSIADLQTEVLRSLSLLTPISNYSASANSILNSYLDSVSEDKAAPQQFSDTFEDLIIQIATVDREALEIKLAGLKERAKAARSALEQLREKMNIYTGEISGFSIFDFLAIMIALYTISMDKLAGLLNTEAKQRLAKDMPFIAGSAVSQDVALQALHEKVSEILIFSDAAYDGSLANTKIS